MIYLKWHLWITYNTSFIVNVVGIVVRLHCLGNDKKNTVCLFSKYNCHTQVTVHNLGPKRSNTQEVGAREGLTIYTLEGSYSRTCYVSLHLKVHYNNTYDNLTFCFGFGTFCHFLFFHFFECIYSTRLMHFRLIT